MSNVELSLSDKIVASQWFDNAVEITTAKGFKLLLERPDNNKIHEYKGDKGHVALYEDDFAAGEKITLYLSGAEPVDGKTLLKPQKVTVGEVGWMQEVSPPAFRWGTLKVLHTYEAPSVALTLG